MVQTKGSIACHVVGQVSKSVLLTRLLPLSFATFFVGLAVAASFFPDGYDWRMDVISKLTSPEDNPKAYWIASLGTMIAMLFALPFGGYVGDRLHAVSPRMGKIAGFTFSCGFMVMAVSMIAQLLEPIIGFHKLHTYLAQTAAGFFIVGMICCCASALKDRFGVFGGRAALPISVSSFWASLTLVPVVVLGTIAVLLILGGQAEEVRQSFRHTVFWHLAFWEWVGALVACAFLTGSVALLPVSSTTQLTAGNRLPIKVSQGENSPA